MEMLLLQLSLWSNEVTLAPQNQDEPLRNSRGGGDCACVALSPSGPVLRPPDFLREPLRRAREKRRYSAAGPFLLSCRGPASPLPTPRRALYLRCRDIPPNCSIPLEGAVLDGRFFWLYVDFGCHQTK